MKLLNENEVTVKSLVDLFESAFIKVTEVNEQSFKVKAKSYTTTISVEFERKLIRLHIWFPAIALSKLSLAEAALIANSVNDKYILLYFSASESGENLFIDSHYYMSFEEGLICYQLIDITKKFEEWTLTRFFDNFDKYMD